MPTAAGRGANHSMRDDRRSQDFTLGIHRGPSHVEMTSPDGCQGRGCERRAQRTRARTIRERVLMISRVSVRRRMYSMHPHTACTAHEAPRADPPLELDLQCARACPPLPLPAVAPRPRSRRARRTACGAVERALESPTSTSLAPPPRLERPPAGSRLAHPDNESEPARRRAGLWPGEVSPVADSPRPTC
jgi:hypothetical protein